MSKVTIRLEDLEIGPDEQERLLARLSALSEIQPSGCHLWVGQERSSGYGGIRIRSKKVWLAHRVAYALAYGGIEANQVVRHTCNVRKCISPEHLLIGSIADNNADMLAAGRRIGNDDKAAQTQSILRSYTVRDIRTGETFVASNRECKRRFGKGSPDFLRHVRTASSHFEIVANPLLAKGEKVSWDRPSKLRDVVKALSEATADGCWHWQGEVKDDAYGIIKVGGKRHPAHVASYFAFKEQFQTKDFVVRHTCHTKSCVNPDHLIRGTQMENVRDNMKAGKIVSSGEVLSKRKSEIFGLRIRNGDTGQVSIGLKPLARELGISPRTLRRRIDQQQTIKGILYTIESGGPLTVPHRLVTRSGADNAFAKRVVCVETGLVYPTLTSAANAVGVKRSAISQAIRRKGTSGGYHWLHEDDFGA